VNDTAKKEKAKLNAAKASRESRRVSFGPSQRSESSFAEDAALDNAFDAAADIQDESMDNSDEDDEIMDDDDSELSDHMPPIDIASDYSSAEELSNDDGTSDGESGDESDESDDVMEEDDEDDSDNESGDEIFSDEEEAEGESWNLDETMNNEFFDADEEANNGAGGNNEVDDSTNLEGWTRIENGGQASRGGLGNMLLDMVQPHQGQHSGNGGFPWDAAENILGQWCLLVLQKNPVQYSDTFF
jgi:hypothetical protein